MTFNGWAVSLNGVMLISTCEVTQEDWDDLDCAPTTVLDGLTSIPDGLDLPGRRTEDVTYFQRDGVKHFSDWYEPRIITVQGILGPMDGNCPECGTVREQLQELVQAWKRGCCDTEIVIFSDCYGTVYESIPALGPSVFRYNLATAPEATRFVTGDLELGPLDWAAGGFATYSLQPAGGPSGGPATFARATSTSASPFGSLIWLNVAAAGSDPITAGSGVPVTEGEDYTWSAWMRSSTNGANFSVAYRFYDENGDAVGAQVDTVVATGVLANTWTRVDETVTVPVGATRVLFVVYTTGATIGMTTDVTGILFEQASITQDYFSGNTANSDPTPELGEEKVTNGWLGGVDESNSSQEIQVYVAGQNRELNGPFGAIGRPREFKYNWIDRKEQIVEFVASFHAVDHRLYVLDDCGNPGYAECVDIDPGVVTYSLCMSEGTGPYVGSKVICSAGAGVCMTTLVDSESVDPVELNVGGTERVFPTIVLSPNLSNPRVENITTGEYVAYSGVIGDTPVTINTEDGTAFDAEGNSLTHLLSGSLFLSLDPGNYEWRLVISGEPDEEAPGSAQVCWRDTVVNA